MTKLKVKYGPVYKSPQYIGDPAAASYSHEVFLTDPDDETAVANKLEALGFHVMRKVVHPNGRGGTPLRVFVKTKNQRLPTTLL